MIKLRNVNFEYTLKSAAGEQVFHALKNINLEIAQGEFVSIIGTSGSGKSTLMNVLGLMATPVVTPDSQVLVSSKETLLLDEDELSQMRNTHLGFVFQHFFLLPRLTVLENILLPVQYLDLALKEKMEETQGFKERAMSLLHEVGLFGQEHKFPATLSGGQKQRVAICRALILNPKIILADEPSGALDTVSTETILALLERLNSSGKTVIVITHDKKVAERSRRIVTLKDGEIVSDVMGSASTKGLASDQSLGAAPEKQQKEKKILLVRKTLEGLATTKQALANLFANPVRSLLTVFGLSIGVSSIIIMITLTSEAKEIFRRFFATAGSQSGYIMFDRRKADSLGSGRWRGLSVTRELPSINKYFEKYGTILAETEEEGCQVASQFSQATSTVKGVDSLKEFSVAEAKLTIGRYFSPSELSEGAASKVAILGKSAADKLFPKQVNAQNYQPNYPLGERVQIRGGCSISANLLVVGILDDLDATFDNSVNESLWVPTRTLLSSGSSNYARRFNVTSAAGVSPTWFTSNVEKFLSIQINDAYPLRSFVPEQQIAKVNMMINMLGALTIIVGALCTVIGGIGVMNIMLVNIAERIREIGIRKAIGAQRVKIRNQFVFESSVLCLMGGLLGLVIGLVVCNLAIYVAAQFIPKMIQYAFVFNVTAVAIALATSVAAGFGFGLLPARRAAKMDVVESLRSE